MGKGLEFYNQLTGSAMAGDVDGLIQNQYHEDAEMVTFEFVLKGREAIKQYMTEGERAQAGKILSFDTIYFAESDDVILYTARVNTEKIGEFIARDALYLQDGKITRHISMTLPPNKDLYPNKP